MEDKRMLIMAGGTGGHVFPGLALAQEMQTRGFHIDWLGTENGLEAKLVKEAGIPLHFIPVRGVRGKNLKTLLLAPWNILSSVLSASAVIRRLKPKLVVGLGGFVAGPGGLAAYLLGIPLIIHEQNAVAGTTNKLLARFAKRVLTAFPDALRAAVCIGNPVRKALENIAPPEDRLAARTESTNVLVVGGSRGAAAINRLVPAAFARIKAAHEEKKMTIWHQAGEGKDEQTRQAYEQAGVEAKVDAFVSDMVQAYGWADIVICRAGALTVSELACVGLGSILIPFPYAIDDHQTANARFLEQAGAAVIKQQKELTAEKLASLLEGVLFDRAKLIAMARHARSVAKPRSVETFADYCEELAHA